MNSGENIPVQEIVIIRRKNDGEGEGHHGGMWKIAFADFMTAMMAFFLVMWLISAANPKTLGALATYFNPIKLPDQQRSEKALTTAQSSGGENQESTQDRQGPKGQKSRGKNDEESTENEPRVSEEMLFTDPYGVLAKLASQVRKTPLPFDAGIRKDDATQYAGGAAFRDPFDPEFRKRSETQGGELLPGQGSGQSRPGPDVEAPEPTPPAAGVTQPKPSDAQVAQPQAEKPQAEQPQIAQSPESASGAEEAAKAKESVPAQDSAGKGAQGTVDAGLLEANIKESLRQAGLQDLPEISVTRSSEGLLISLTDKLDFEMFALSSAKPKPELVAAMERIGRLLRQRKEMIVLRGHTDARPFRSGTYDNWRLSTDRANMAHYMLVRGGVTETRFDRIEGHADKELKVPSDPKAAANRRIEILLKQTGS